MSDTSWKEAWEIRFDGQDYRFKWSEWNAFFHWDQGQIVFEGTATYNEGERWTFPTQSTALRTLR